MEPFDLSSVPDVPEGYTDEAFEFKAPQWTDIAAELSDRYMIAYVQPA